MRPQADWDLHQAVEREAGKASRALPRRSLIEWQVATIILKHVGLLLVFVRPVTSRLCRPPDRGRFDRAMQGKSPRNCPTSAKKTSNKRSYRLPPWLTTNFTRFARARCASWPTMALSPKLGELLTARFFGQAERRLSTPLGPSRSRYDPTLMDFELVGLLADFG